MIPPKARPILKWAGGKSRSLQEILRALPERIDSYYEPFVGGAAVFFALSSAGRFRRAVLSDRNPDLVDVYRGLKNDVDAVIRILGEYRYDRDEFYRIRALVPKDLSPEERAARVIFLNKTGYNGLYRVNSKGEFNVPFGRYKNPRFCDPESLRAASLALRKVRLDVRDFEAASRQAERGDAVYFDPPYYPVSRTASFTSYDKNAFGRADHERLARTFDALARRGVGVVLSNSDTPFTARLFSGWYVKRIAVSRPINSKASQRGAVPELLVTNRSLE